jgi:alkaline phosphatase D
LEAPCLGNITPDGISVWVRTTAPAAVKLVLKDQQGTEIIIWPGAFGLGVGVNSHYTCSRDFGPRCCIRHPFIIDDEKIALDQDFSIRLPAVEEGKEITRIAFGSCYHRWGLGNDRSGETPSGNRSPAALLLNGDIAAQDQEQPCRDAPRRLPDARFFHPMEGTWQHQCPVYAVWDDHDYFDDDLAGIPEGFTQADKEKVWDVFRESWNNPSYGIGKESKGVFFSTRIGPCDVIMTDNRYFRDGETSTFLGEEQMAWIEEQLLCQQGPLYHPGIRDDVERLMFPQEKTHGEPGIPKAGSESLAL